MIQNRTWKLLVYHRQIWQMHCSMNNQICIFLMLYADDTLLFSESLDGMQSMLDKFSNYCKMWKLEVNTSKTKVVIFFRSVNTGLRLSLIQTELSQITQMLIYIWVFYFIIQVVLTLQKRNRLKNPKRRYMLSITKLETFDYQLTFN